MNGTGPLGLGPMTGRAMGFCAGRVVEDGRGGTRIVVPSEWAGLPQEAAGGYRAGAREVVRQNRKEAVMPGGDRTGPMGMGPVTGRGAGFCAGFPVPGYMNPMPGRGFGRGFFGRGGGGRGRGFRHRYFATGVPGWAWFGGEPWGAPPPAPEQEVEALKRQAEFFEQSLGEIRKRIDELEAAAKKDE